MYLSDRVTIWQIVLVVPYGHNLSFGLWSPDLFILSAPSRKTLKPNAVFFFSMTLLELASQNLNISIFICLFFKVLALSIFYYCLDFPFSSDFVAHKTPRLFLVSFWHDFTVDGSEGSIYNSLLFRNVTASHSFLCKGCTGVAIRSSHVKQWPAILMTRLTTWC